jgi:glycerate dehydrogenase
MNIVVLDAFTLNPGDLSWEDLRSIASCEIYDRTDEDNILMRAEEAEIVLTNKTPLSADTLAKLPRLRYIGVLATAYNVVDVAFALNQLVEPSQPTLLGPRNSSSMAHLLR